MVGKNNKFLKENKNNQRFLRFSLRKLSVGVVSVAIAAGFYIGGSQSVLADTTSTVPVVSQSTSNDNLVESTDKNTVTLQNSSTSTDPSAVASAADSTAAEAGKSAVPAAEQQKTATFNVAEEKPVAALNTANLLDNKAQSKAASDAAKAEEDQLADEMLKNIKISDPIVENQDVKYNDLVNKDDYIFSVIRDNRINTDFIWTVNRDSGRDASVYLYDRNSREVYHKKFTNSSNLYYDDDNVIFNYTLKKEYLPKEKKYRYYGSVDTYDKFESLQVIYGLDDSVKKFSNQSYASISEILPEKGQSIVRLMGWDTETGTLNKIVSIPCPDGLTGQTFKINANYYQQYINGKKVPHGFVCVGVSGNNKGGTFTQFEQGYTYTKHYVQDDSEVIYHQINASGKMQVEYQYYEPQGLFLPDKLVTISAGELSAGQSETIDNVTIRNPFASNKTFEIIYVPISDVKQEITRKVTITEPGQKTRTITQIAEISRSAKFDPKTDEVTYGNWSTNTADWTAVDVPSHAGYTTHISNGADSIPAVTVKDGQQSEIIDVTYTANPQTGKIVYVDVDNQNAEVGHTDLTGDTDQDVTITPKAPAGYDIVAGQNIPATEKATADGIPTVTVQVNHHKRTVTPGDEPKPGDKIPGNPNKQPGDGTPKTDVSYETLHRNMTRTINVTDPHTGLKPTKVTLHYERTATIDDVTGEVTYGNWTVVDGSQAGFKAFNIPTVAGYSSEIKSGSADDLQALTPSQAQITDWTDQTVDIDYTANPQTGKIVYVDVDNQNAEVGHTDLTGDTDQDVTITPKAPAGYDIVAGQNIPATEKATADGIPTVTVQVNHHKRTVTPGDEPKPGDKIPGNPNKQPGDGTPKTDVSYETLHRNMTRTINVTDPHTGLKPTKVTLHYERTATIDDVTGEVTYGNWTVVDGSQAGFKAFNIPTVAGYSSEIKSGSADDLQALTPSQAQITDWTDQTVDIDYTANPQTGKIVYVDVDNQNAEVGHTDLTGDTDQDVTITPKAPAGYDIVAGQNIPATEKATADGIPTVTVQVNHHKRTVTPGDEPKPGDKIPGNPNKQPGDGTPKTDVSYETLHRNMTRTINVTDPHTGLKPTKVTLHYERTATIDDVTGEVTYGNWTVVDGSQAGFKAFNIPTVAGYSSEIKSGSADDLQALTPSQAQITDWTDQTVDIDYTANPQTGKIVYVDVDNQNAEVGHTDLTGDTDQDVTITPKAPAGYDIVAGQNIPATEKATADGIPTVTVQVNHHKRTVTPGDEPKPGDKIPGNPNKQPGDGTPKTDVSYETLHRNMTRTINVTDPHTGLKPTKVTLHYERTATIDDVTGEVTYGNWTVVDGSQAGFKAFNIPTVAGYSSEIKSGSADDLQALTPSQAQITDWTDQTVDIDYTANPQTGKIVYVDVDNQNAEVGHTDLTGDTDQDVTITPKAPAGYDIVAGQNIPATEKATADGIPTVTVQVNHHKRTVTPGDEPKPGDKIPGNPNKQPGDGTPKTDVSYETLHRNMTRTINVTDPHTGLKPTKVTLHYERTATIDDVTGEVTYGNWTVVDGSQAGFKAFNIPTVAGYSSEIKSGSADDLQALTPSQAQITDWTDQTVDIDYTANPQTGKIVYVDVDNQNAEVGHTDLTGDTDQDVTITPKAPAGYDIVAGQNIPATEKATADGIPTVTVQVNHHKRTVTPGDEPKPGDKIPGNPNKQPGDGTPKTDVSYETLHRNMTRTINVTDPHTGLKPTKVTLHYERTATIDDVTGEVTYGNWTVVDGSQAGFKAFNIPTVAGYSSEIKSGSADDLQALTPSQAQITDWTDQTVDIDYTANPQTGKIVYVDVDNQNAEVGHTDLTGDTDQDVTITPKAPAGYDIVAGQNIPATEKATADGIPTVTVQVNHHKRTVTPGDEPKPGDKIPGNPNKQPGDGTPKTDVSYETLHRNMTRTINVTDPHTGLKPTKVTLHYERTATIDDVTGEVTYGNWTVVDGSQAGFKAFNIPTVAGYSSEIKSGSADDLQALTPSQAQITDWTDQTVDIDYTANPQTGKIVYVDVDNQNAEVGHTDLTGDTDQDVTITPKAPAGYDIVAGQNIPATEKATADGIPTVTVQVNHHKRTVTPGDEPKPGDKIPGNPNKQPGDGTPKTDVSYETLHRNMTRTINVTDPHTGLKPTKVTLHYERTATIDDVTGEVTYGNWTVVDGSQAGFKAFNIPTVAGYSSEIKSGSADDLQALTPSQAQITDWTDQTVDIDYTANPQTGKIVYVDVDNQNAEVGHTDLTGDTDQDVTITPKAPAGYDIVAGQNIPATEKATADGIPTVTVQVNHHKRTVTPGDEPKPGDKIPGNPNKQPGDGTPKTDVSYETLHRNMTRTINVTDPHTGLKPTKVTLHYERTATIDDVTGEVTYGNWTVVDGSQAGFKAFNIPTVAGYSSEIKSGSADDLQALTPSQAQITDWTDQTVDIDYTANPQTGKIVYVDVDNQNAEVGHTDLTGDTDQDVTITPKAPAGYDIVAGQNIPATEKATADGIPTVTVQVNHHKRTVTPGDEPKPGDKIPGNPNKQPGDGTPKTDVSYETLHRNMTRTINVTDPHTGLKPTKVTLHYERTATIDDVTGEVTYGNWTVVDGSQAGFKAFNIPTVAGYSSEIKSGSADDLQALTPSQAQITDWTDQTVDIDYTANPQTGKIVYVDVDNQNAEVGHTDLTGDTDQDVTITPKAPAGYDIVAGQNIPATEKATADGIPTVTVQVNHHKRTVTPGDEPKPGDKIPGNPNKQPGDGTPKTDVSYETLHRNMTRTINVTDPHTGLKPTKVTLHYERTATIDDVTGEVTYGNWTVVDGSQAGFKAFNIPTVAGYSSEIKSGSADDLQALTPSQAQITDWTDQTVDIDYTANPQTGKIVYVDVDNQNAEVGHTDLTGDTDQDVTITPKAPAGYDIVAGQNIPATEKATADGIPTVTVQVNHHKRTVTPGDEPKPGDKIPGNPNKQPGDGTPKTDVSYETLHRNMTRTINVTDPHTGLKPTKVTLHYERTATIDDVTGEVTYGNWTVVDGSQAGFKAFNIPTVAGYSSEIKSGSADDLQALTPSQAQITDWTDQTVDIDYTANPQTGKIVYVDVDNQNAEVGHTDLTGDTDQDVTITPKAPAGYDIVAGQNIPATEKATADGIPTVTVQVNHHKRTVTPGDEPKPGDKIPGNPNKQPGDGTPKTDVSYETLHRNMTRTINVTDPHTGLKPTKVTLHYERTATIDDVTGEVTYGNWTVVDGSQAGFKAFNIPTVAGYSSEIKSGSADDLQALTPSQAQITDWTDQTVDIDYTANDQTMHITYVDKADHPVDGGSFTVSGKTDQTVSTNAKVPAGWVLSQGQTDAPKTIKFTGTPTADITITVEHGTKRIPHDNPVKSGDKTPSGKEIKGAHYEDLNKTITRTINITEPGQATKTTTQVAHIYCDATVDEVTGDVTYGAWSTDAADWVAVDVPVHAGYTTHISNGADSIPAVTVKDGQKDVTINVTYTPDVQNGQITYVDNKGHQISSTPLTGRTDEDIAINPVAPAGWKIVAGQQIPATVKATADGIQGPSILVEHDTTTVKPGDLPNPGDKKPGNPDKKPGDKTPNTDITYNDLHKTATRTITIHDPHNGDTVDCETISFNRSATIDDVIGDVTYGDWTVASDSAQDHFQNVDYPAVPGYTLSATSGEHGEQTLTQDQINSWVDPQIEVSYAPVAQTGKISYVDSNGQEIAHTDLTGETDQDVDVKGKINVPTNWKIVPGQTIPDTVKATADGIPTVTVKVQPKMDSITNPAKLNKSISRTITINKSGEKPQVINQHADFTRTGQYNEVTGATVYTDWTLKGNTLEAVDAPAVPGYTPNVAHVDGVKNPTADTKLNDVVINYTADDQNQVVNYVDPNGKVVKTDTVKGKTDETVKVTPNVPDHYELVPGQEIPGEVKITDDNPAITVKVTPKMDPITDPAKLNKSISRTITINKPGEKPQVINQTATFKRTGKTNEVTGITTYTPWVLDQNGLITVSAPEVPGYTPSQKTVASVDNPTANTKLTDVTINYTANSQTTHINYVDKDGETIKSDTVSGKTDETVKTNSEVPAGWKITDGQIPETIHFTGEETPDTTITIEHDTTSVDHIKPVKPGDKTPSGKVIDGAHDKDLNQTITRTINVKTPDGQTTTTAQVAKIYRDATVDDVTGQVTYGNWSEGSWTDFKPGQIAGYTASPADVPAVTVKDGQQDQTVNITYTANEGTVQIKYVDRDGNEIGRQVITGHVGDTVKVTPQIPEDWVPVDPDTVPTEVQIKEENGQIIIVVIRHGEKDPVQTKNITRTIKVTTPDGQTKTIKQVATISRTGELDLVTGQITWQPWTTAQWDTFKPATIAGYTPSLAEVPAVTVVGETTDQTVIITYTAVVTPTQPDSQAPAASDTSDNRATDQKVNNGAQPEATNTVSQQTANAQQAESTVNNHRLPQTGNSHDASALAGLGLASLMGLFGLGGKRRKHD